MDPKMGPQDGPQDGSQTQPTAESFKAELAPRGLDGPWTPWAPREGHSRRDTQRPRGGRERPGAGGACSPASQHTPMCRHTTHVYSSPAFIHATCIHTPTPTLHLYTLTVSCTDCSARRHPRVVAERWAGRAGAARAGPSAGTDCWHLLTGGLLHCCQGGTLRIQACRAWPPCPWVSCLLPFHRTVTVEPMALPVRRGRAVPLALGANSFPASDPTGGVGQAGHAAFS